MDGGRDPFERTRAERIYFLALLGAVALAVVSLLVFALR